MWSRIRPRCATLLGKSIAVAFSNSRSPREYEFATDRLFQVHATTPSVLDAHRCYLLTRDLAVMSGLFLVALGPTAFVLTDARDWAVIYALSLALLFLSACHAARTYGKRLVTNVLAVESASAT